MEDISYLKIKKAILELKDKNEPLNYHEFLKFLDSVEKFDPEQREYRIKVQANEMTKYLAKHETRLAKYKFHTEFQRAYFDSLISTANSTLRSVILINGGACIAILTLIGHQVENSSLTVPQEFKDALAIFSAGVLSSAVAAAMSYFAQYNYSSNQHKSGDRFRNLSIASVTLGFVFFIIGSWKTYCGF